jgi:phosphoribosylamine-glycine ligase
MVPYYNNKIKIKIIEYKARVADPQYVLVLPDPDPSIIKQN